MKPAPFASLAALAPLVTAALLAAPALTACTPTATNHHHQVDTLTGAPQHQVSASPFRRAEPIPPVLSDVPGR